jgi:hypothetical protein
VELLPKLPSALWAYRVIFFASALNFAHRFFVAFPIFALAAAESTRLALFVTFLSADRPIPFYFPSPDKTLAPKSRKPTNLPVLVPYQKPGNAHLST